MELIPPTNFDDTLVDEFKAMGIKETYGRLAIDVIGGGRFASCLPNVSKKDLVKHIGKLRNAGIKFNYILSAPCLSFEEFTHTGRKKIQELIHWLASNGVKKVTVSIPYILQIIKDMYPDFEVCVSTYAQVDSYQKAKYWQEFGADEITLLDTSVNRNFKLLKIIRNRITTKLRLIGNTSCLYHCPFFQYHALSSSHGSQTAYSHKAGFAVDYCFIYCKYLRLSNPVNFIHSQWIRPEDLNIYEDIGIDGIKLIDRRCPTDIILKITKSYYKRKYDGNLLDLLPGFHGRYPVNFGNLLLKIKYFFHLFESNIFSIFKLIKLSQNIDIVIDNRQLDGFIKKFVEEDCSIKNCSDCQYCDQIAKDVVKYDNEYLEKVKYLHKDFLDNLIKGRY